MRSSMLARSGIVSSFSSAKHIKTTSNIRSVSFINDGFGCLVRDDIILKLLDNEVASSLTMDRVDQKVTVNLLSKSGLIISSAYFYLDPPESSSITNVLLDHANKRLDLTLNNGIHRYCSLSLLYDSKLDKLPSYLINKYLHVNLDGLLEWSDASVDTAKWGKITGNIDEQVDLVLKIQNHHDSTKQDVVSDLPEIRQGAAAGSTAVLPIALLDYRKATLQDVIDNQIKSDLLTEKDRAAAAESLISRLVTLEKKAREDADQAIIRRIENIEQQYVLRSEATQNSLSVKDVHGETHTVSADISSEGVFTMGFE